MKEDKLNPEKDNLVPNWNSRTAKFPFNNRGEVGGDEGGDEGGDVGGEEGGGTGTITTSWRDNLDPSIKDHPSLANFKTPQDVAKSYVNAQSLIGKEKIPVPGKDADPLSAEGRKEWDIVYDRMGRPSDPKAYELPKLETPQGFPETPPETIDGFKQLSHDIGLLPHQVKALYQWQHEQAVGNVKNHTDATATALRASEGELRKEYGKAFDGNLSAAQGLLKKFGGAEVIQALESTGLGNNPHMVRFMVKVARQFGEDGNTLVGDTQSGVLTPAEAKVEVEKIMADKSGAYWNRTDAKGNKPFADSEHKAMVKKVNDLMAMAHPEKQ